MYQGLYNLFEGQEPKSTTQKSTKSNPNYWKHNTSQKSVLPDIISNVKYLSCNIQDHQQEPLSMVCIDQLCPQNGLICALCEGISHYKHQCVPLKIFLNDIFGANNRQQKIEEQKVKYEQETTQKKKKRKNMKSQKTSHKIAISNTEPISDVAHIANIQKLKQEALRKVKQGRQSILDSLHNLQVKINQYYNNITQQYHQIIQLKNPTQFITKITEYTERRYNNCVSSFQNEKVKKMKNFINKIVKAKNFSKQNGLTDKLRFIQMRVNKVSEQIMSSLSKSLKHFTDETMKCQGILKQEQENRDNYTKMCFLFCQSLKGSKFVIKSDNTVAEQTGNQSSGQRFCLIQPSLHKGISTWSIKILKLVGWVGIGISLKKMITKANYHFNYHNIGHGSYLISGNGYSWSHSQKDFNSAYKSFSFTTGDVIHLQYNGYENKLKFYKNQKEKQFILDVEDAPFDDEYCPSINLCSVGDTVEIINQKVEFL